MYCSAGELYLTCFTTLLLCVCVNRMLTDKYEELLELLQLKSADFPNKDLLHQAAVSKIHQYNTITVAYHRTRVNMKKFYEGSSDIFMID